MEIEIATDSELGIPWVTIRNPGFIVDFSYLINRKNPFVSQCYREFLRLKFLLVALLLHGWILLLTLYFEHLYSSAG
jgi:hypothetical protein